MSIQHFNFARDVLDGLAVPDRTGLIFVDEYGHRRDYYFSEIVRHSSRYAGAFERLGINAGRRVLVGASNTAKGLFSLLALERLGAVAIPCSRDLSTQETVRQAEKYGATAVVTDRGRRSQFEALRADDSQVQCFLIVGEDAAGWTRLDRVAEQATPSRGPATAACEPACILGGISYDRASLAGVRPSADRVLQAAESDVVWCTLGVGAPGWFANVYLGPWTCGSVTVVHDAPFRAAERLDLLRELDVTIALQPSSEYDAQVQTIGAGRFHMPRLRRCLALEAVNAATAESWQAFTHLSIEDAAGGVHLTAS